MDDAASRLRTRSAELAPVIYGRVDSPEAARARDAAIAELEALRAEAAAVASPSAEPEPAPRRPRRPSRRPVLLATTGGLVVAVIVVAGILIPRPETTPVVVATDTPTATPRPTATPTPAATPTRTPPPPVVVTPPPTEQIDYRLDYFEDNIVSAIQVPIDGPPIDNANGQVAIDDYGVPLYYIVASGDVFELIAKRFDLGTTYLAGINAVRRAEPTVLYVGDTINLGATTILRIGDQNGVVYDFTDRLPEPRAPQD